ncbi:hypothetical protein C8F04DRAFT_1259177 [Mycena alexandri]|uniref:NGN domain-containing protein n=1 Tax=Mycena alexandri TaxID=1745969 RepID=A0AAD6SXY7_9AGAR|nr:hypothetical protein C8F04DRAFT_1259177 [Mycena alexandri]
MRRSDETKQILRAQRIHYSRVFLDLEARTSEHEEEEDDFEDDFDGFLDRRAFADDPHPRPIAVAMLDDVGPSLQEEADAIRARHRDRMDREGHFEPGQDIFQWVHAEAAHPALTDAAIWRLRVKSGHEADVVRTATLILPGSQFHASVKSITAPATMRGSVYIETDEIAAVKHLQSRVAFVLQNFQAVRVPLADYVSLVFSKSPALLSSHSWARVKRKGPYCGSLAWIQNADPYACCYELWLVPIAADEDPYGPLCQCYLLNGNIASLDEVQFRGGLLAVEDVPLYAVVEDDPCPTLQELGQFLTSQMTSDGRVPEDGEDLLDSVQTSISLLHHICPAMRGDQVYIIAGALAGCFGTVIVADARLLTVKLVSSTDTEEQVERSAFVYRLYPGDLVEVVRGPRQAVKCWILSIDWEKQVANAVAHSFAPYIGPDGPSALDIPASLDLDEFDIGLAFVRPTSQTFLMSSPSVISPPPAKPPAKKMKITQTPDPLANIEVRIGGKNKLSGVFGTIECGDHQYKAAWILTEGRAENVKVKIPLEQLTERHTGKSLKDYVGIPVPVRLAMRRDRERRWAGILDPALEESLFHGAMTGQWAHPSITIDRRDLFPQLYETHTSADAPTAQPDSSATTPAIGLSEGGRREPSSSDPACLEQNYGLPGGQMPGLWLTQPALRGHSLDVVIRNSQRSHRGKYEGKIGTLVIPTGKKISMGNRDNSLEVTINSSFSLKQPFKLWNIFPLTTTEFEGHISAHDSVSLTEAIGAWALIIGPDKLGSPQYVGKFGEIHHGGYVVVDNE